mgnify:CR=1 FL=1
MRKRNLKVIAVLAAAAMVLAGLAAQGVTEVTQIFHIDRGYEAIETVLSGIGASIQREILE